MAPVSCIALTPEQVQIHLRTPDCSKCCYKLFLKFLNNIIRKNTFAFMLSVHDTISLSRIFIF